MAAGKEKQRLSVLQSHSLRGLIEEVDKINVSGQGKILKEDILTVFYNGESYVMLYYY